jgi:hypothetical protein
VNSEILPIIAVRHDHDRSRDWVALERFAATATRSGAPVDPGEFMWIESVTVDVDGVAHDAHAYKHVESRRTVYVDDAGHTYRYRHVDDDIQVLVPFASPLDAVTRWYPARDQLTLVPPASVPPTRSVGVDID